MSRTPSPTASIRMATSSVVNTRHSRATWYASAVVRASDTTSPVDGFKGAEDLNRWMVANGWAVAYRRYSVDYVADEDAARRKRINMWSGDFEMPWDRRAQR
jgi:endonuclease YncB( thermonuclease family)